MRGAAASTSCWIRFTPIPVILDASVPLGWLGAGLLEIEDQSASREHDAVTALERSEKEAGLLCGCGRRHAVALRAIEVELKQRNELARLQEPVRPIDARPVRIEVVRKHLLALADLLRDAVLELVVGTEIADLVVGLHLDETARNQTPRNIEVEEGEVGSLEADFVA